MDFATTIAQFIDRHTLLDKQRPVLVALSGGADSVALLRVLHELGYDCEAAHCNFHLRGDESLRDEAFVTELCRVLDVELHVMHFDVDAYKATHGVSTEMACRELRYQWFEQTRIEQLCQAIAVAHHGDDNVETVFLNMLRGTGIHGMAGMKPRNGNIVRPLLCVSHAQVLDYLKQLGQDFVVDSTNADNSFKRNWLRNELLPAIYNRYPQAQSTLPTSIEQIAQCDSLYSELITRAASDLCNDINGGMIIYGDKLLAYENCTLLLFEITRNFGFRHEQCANAISALQEGVSSGKKFFSSTHLMATNRHNIEIFQLKETLQEDHSINLNNKKIENPVSILIDHICDTPFSPSVCNGTSVVAFDRGVLDCHKITLRRWRQGDRFKPFGMKGSKLVSDLFADLKLGEREKRDTWLLEADGEILWVLGYRAADAFTVKPGATDYMVLRLQARD